MRLFGYFTYKNYILIILEYVNNRDLKHFMKKYCNLNNQPVFSETLTAHFILQTLKALGYLKLKNIVHRDVKPENLLLNSNFMVKLGDFTLARKIEQSVTVNTSRSGTIPYLSPECIVKKTEIKSSQCEKLDLFSLGVVMYMLLFNKHPFNYKNSLSCNEYTEILEKNELALNVENIKLTENCKNFLKGLLEKDIDKRFSYEQAINHPWVLGMKEKLSKLTEVFDHDGEKLISELNKEDLDDDFFSKYKSYEITYDEKTQDDSINNAKFSVETLEKFVQKKRKRPQTKE